MADQEKLQNVDELMLHCKTKVRKESFGNVTLPKYGNVELTKYTLDNGFMSVSIINYGSTITSIKLPDIHHNCDDIVLGFDDVNGYIVNEKAYIGSAIGRVSNRIGNGSYQYDNKTYHISKNVGSNTLHGGITGFDKKIWSTEIVNDNSLLMKYLSPDLEEGFPGDLDTSIRYVLTDNNYLILKFTATTNKVTPVSLTNHAYFNLAGHKTNADGLFKHDLQIYADEYTEKNNEFITTGVISKVEGTPFDFREFHNLGKAIKESPDGEGFDLNYCVKKDGLRTVARVKHEASGRSMQVFSNQPAVQLYTSNSIVSMQGKDGATYRKHAALCLETQSYPNAVNIKSFPPPWLHPNEKYEHILVFKFGVGKGPQ